MICARLRPGHLSVRVGDSSRRCEEIVKTRIAPLNAIIIIIALSFFVSRYGYVPYVLQSILHTGLCYTAVCVEHLVESLAPFHRCSSLCQTTSCCFVLFCFVLFCFVFVYCLFCFVFVLFFWGVFCCCFFCFLLFFSFCVFRTF